MVDEGLTVQCFNDARRLAVEVSQKVHQTNKRTLDKGAKADVLEEGLLVMRKVEGLRGGGGFAGPVDWYVSYQEIGTRCL